MKFIFKTILKYYLKYITKIMLLIHGPTIIAIAGSTNKTFAKEKIVKALKGEGISLRANPRSFNTEIGLPLAILYLPSGYNSYKKWVPTIKQAFCQLWQSNFPKFLILELGISDPGDMKYLLSIIKPKIVVITDISQRYLESFSDMDELAGEYEYLARKISQSSVIVLNYDNIKVRSLSKITKAKTEFFGFDNNANWQAMEVKKYRKGQYIKIGYNDVVNQYEINKFGKHHIYALLISLIVSKYVKKN